MLHTVVISHYVYCLINGDNWNDILTVYFITMLL